MTGARLEEGPAYHYVHEVGETKRRLHHHLAYIAYIDGRRTDGLGRQKRGDWRPIIGLFRRKIEMVPAESESHFF